MLCKRTSPSRFMDEHALSFHDSRRATACARTWACHNPTELRDGRCSVSLSKIRLWSRTFIMTADGVARGRICEISLKLCGMWSFPGTLYLGKFYRWDSVSASCKNPTITMSILFALIIVSNDLVCCQSVVAMWGILTCFILRLYTNLCPTAAHGNHAH